MEVARAESERVSWCSGAGGTTATMLELRANGVFVMDTRETSSERELARRRWRGTEPETCSSAGSASGSRSRRCWTTHEYARVVVEIEPALVGWLRDGTVPHGPALLADARRGRRRRRRRRDRAVRGATYDVVLLDVDNGPGNLVHDANAALYDTGCSPRRGAR